MKNSVTTALAGLLIVGAAAAQQSAPTVAPKFALKDTTGKLWDAKSMRGKTILIDFWASW